MAKQEDKLILEGKEHELPLVVGSEGEGMRDLVRRRCDTLVRLPMLGQVESLNAAVAGSVILYMALQQRAGARD